MPNILTLRVFLLLFFIGLLNHSFAQLSVNNTQKAPIILHHNSFNYELSETEKSYELFEFPNPVDSSKTMNKLDKVNSFMEWYMKYFPVPFGSYSKETSWLFGLPPV